MPACRACGHQAPEASRFCPACGARLADQAGPPAEELRKVVTVVFCDLTGSTSMGERLDSESLRGVMSRYFATMEAVLRRHGGTVEKFIGDAIMAVFGIPTVHEDDALRAVRAAVEMRDALDELNDRLEARWGVRLKVRTGVNTGEVVAGDPTAGHGFVTGDAVNVAARLEQAAGPDEILIGPDTRRLVRDAIRAEAVEPLALKGKAQRMPAFRLLEVSPGAPGVARRLDSPLVGRREELARLRAAFDAARADRRCALATILGPAGAGKSRLVAELAARLGDEARVVTGRCLAYGEGITYWPVAEMLRALVEISGDDPPEAARAKLEARVGPDEDAEGIVRGVAALMGLGDGASSPAETSWALRRLLEAVARGRPLVVVFDDVHWAEPAFLELLEYLARSSRGVPILLVVLARTELLETRPALAEVAGTTISLAPLSGAESRALVEHLLDDEVDAEALDRVAAAADGNPLFVEELLRMLVEEGHLVLRDGRWTPVGALPLSSAPPTIQTLIAARLDRLPRAERAVVERAAVVGRVVWPGAVRALSPEPERGEVDRHLEALVAKQLIAPHDARLAGEGALAFGHDLVRTVAYDRMLKAVRADLHERCAAWLERTAGERAVEHEEILAYHLEQAARYLADLQAAEEHRARVASEAAARLASAGGRALARGDMPAAVNLLERASSLLAEDDPARRDLALTLGIALAGTGQMTRVGSLLTERLAAEQRGRAFLVFHDPGGRQHTVSLDDAGGAVTIGRKADNDVALVWDSQVSRLHAELRVAGEEWMLVDEGTSRNGSFLNGEAVRGRRALADGDVLRFGDTVLLFRRPAAAPEAPAAGPEPDGATAFGRNPLAAVSLSGVERRVLDELRSEGAAPSASASRPDHELAAQLSLSEDEVRAVLTGLKLKLGVDAPSEERGRERLVVRAVSSGLLSD